MENEVDTPLTAVVLSTRDNLQITHPPTCVPTIGRSIRSMYGYSLCMRVRGTNADEQRMIDLLGVILHSGGWTGAINRKGTCSIIVR